MRNTIFKNKMQGIYEIKNKITNEVYVGQALNIKNRISGHFCALRKNKHSNSHLQNSFNKHGIGNFEWKVLEQVDNVEELTNKEQYWYNILNETTKLYNQREFVDSNKNVPCSPEKRAKISMFQRNEDGTTKTLEQKHGKEKAEEIRKRISESSKGKKQPGRILSEERKKKTSETMKQRKHKPPKTAHDKISELRKGKTYEEIYGKEKANALKQKLSLAHKKENK